MYHITKNRKEETINPRRISKIGSWTDATLRSSNHLKKYHGLVYAETTVFLNIPIATDLEEMMSLLTNSISAPSDYPILRCHAWTHHQKAPMAINQWGHWKRVDSWPLFGGHFLKHVPANPCRFEASENPAKSPHTEEEKDTIDPLDTILLVPIYAPSRIQLFDGAHDSYPES